MPQPTTRSTTRKTQTTQRARRTHVHSDNNAAAGISANDVGVNKKGDGRDDALVGVTDEDMEGSFYQMTATTAMLQRQESRLVLELMQVATQATRTMTLFVI